MNSILQTSIFLLAISLFLGPIAAMGQHTLSGWVKEEGSGEPISFVNISVKESKRGSISNESGFFALSLPSGSLTLELSRIGYAPTSVLIELKKDTLISFYLGKDQTYLDTVSIQAGKQDFQQFQLGKTIVPMKQLGDIPSFGGEGDIMKSLQLLPGIQFGQEGTSNLHVRGGSPDQNLILIDDMPVYNVNHLFGFVSLFPTGAIQDAEVYKGAFPAQYGGRLSSVIKLQSKEGNMDQWKKEMVLGPLSSQLRVEGPIIKEKSSIFVTARRSWIDLLLRPLTAAVYRNSGIGGSLGYGFYDLIAKGNYILSPKTRIYASVYAGRDRGGLSTRPLSVDGDSIFNSSRGELQWGNLTTSLRLEHVLSKKWFYRTMLGFTRYNYRQQTTLISENINEEGSRQELSKGNFSSIRDWINKHEWDAYLGPGHQLKLGLQYSWKTFEPDVTVFLTDNQDGRIDTAQRPEPFSSHLLGFFAGYTFSASDIFKLYLGGRADMFSTQGISQAFLQPRAQMGFHFTERLKLELGYSYIKQYIHLLTNSGVGLPTDLWVPATQETPPASSHQITGGLFYQLSPELSLSVEGYWKNLDGVIEYKDGVNFVEDFTNWEENVDVGQGQNYGLEVLLHKKRGKWNGWLGYNLAFANRTFDQINSGRTFPYRYDRRHNVSIFVNRQFRKPGKSLSATWVYLSGARATLPTEQYSTPFDYFNLLNGFTENLLGTDVSYLFGNAAVFADGRNNYRFRPFHKLDLAYRTTKQKKKGERSWEFGIYNVYGRQNPYFITLESKRRVDLPNRPWQTSLAEYSLFVWLPYVNWSIRW